MKCELLLAKTVLEHILHGAYQKFCVALGKYHGRPDFQNVVSYAVS